MRSKFQGIQVIQERDFRYAFMEASIDHYSSELLCDLELPLGFDEWIVSRKASFVFSRLLARKLLGLNSKICLLNDANGVPVLKNRGATPTVSISHSLSQGKMIVACVVALNAHDEATNIWIGIDVENFTRKVDHLAAKIMTQTERNLLGDSKVLEVFGAKEALYKAVFPRTKTYFGFQQAEISEDRIRITDSSLTKELDRHQFDFHIYRKLVGVSQSWLLTVVANSG